MATTTTHMETNPTPAQTTTDMSLIVSDKDFPRPTICHTVIVLLDTPRCSTGHQPIEEEGSTHKPDSFCFFDPKQRRVKDLLIPDIQTDIHLLPIADNDTEGSLTSTQILGGAICNSKVISSTQDHLESGSPILYHPRDIAQNQRFWIHLTTVLIIKKGRLPSIGPAMINEPHLLELLRAWEPSGHPIP